MKKLQIVTLAGVLLASSAVGAQSPAPAAARTTEQPGYRTKKLSRTEFDRLASQPQGLLVIDVRRPDELTAIGGFPVYLSIQAADVERYLPWIPKDRTIVTVSNHANRSGRVGDLLTSRGFTVAGTIGVQDYETEGGTLTKIALPKSGAR